MTTNTGDIGTEKEGDSPESTEGLFQKLVEASEGSGKGGSPSSSPSLSLNPDGSTPDSKKAEGEPKEEDKLKIESAPDDKGKGAVAWESDQNPYKHQYKSDEGRIKALQNKITALQESAKTKDTDLLESVKKSLSESEGNLNEVYPELASILDKHLDLRAQKEPAKEDNGGQITELQNSLSEAVGTIEQLKLSVRFPDFQQMAESEEFKAWVGLIPKDQLGFLESNQADVVIEGLSQFERYQAQNKEKVEETDRLAAEKKEKLEKAAKMPLSSSAATPLLDGSGDNTAGLFQQLMDKADKRG